MNDLELQALVAIVNRETARTNADVAQFGQLMSDPHTDAYLALYVELERRGVIPLPKPVDNEIPFR